MSGIVIIGNGIAAVSAAMAVRRVTDSEEILICSAEPYMTYYRIQLSNRLGTSFSAEDILVYQPSWYKKNKIDLLLGQKVVDINLAGKEISTQDNKIIFYDKLIIASGSRPKIPEVSGLEKKGLFTLRSYKDTQIIKEYGENCQDFIIIGGGVLGMETAGALRRWKKNVKLLVNSNKLLNRQLDPEGASVIDQMVRNQGVEIFYDSQVKEISGQEKVDGVLLKNGDYIRGEVVIFAAGVTPETRFLRSSSILGTRGVTVDENLRTSNPHVYAAGDVTEFNGSIQGRWPVAKTQGEIAGFNAAGKETIYKEIPSYSLIQAMGMQIYSAGDVNEKDKETYTSGDSTSGYFRKLFFTKGRLVGAVLIGDVTYGYLLKEAIISGKDYSILLNRSHNTEELMSNLVKDYQYGDKF
ncbi:NAD(P)/FAD-dependent oxidoreductase [Candidatus Contubernalis alkaliaceticus]|uniref:NAD(P)/FAD-dependent oxidoreductase n=1 Tax=Candidatus Contubernalis alkaliaceticus TaxID=338645 RepID=UPI001F4C373E|nr:FAD-dependent oxidoreductase [Candidatus Contubernalis alkalaceticus]UNC92259.1 NAD(P)/FAD-dependent oxidoreductase [Candidatus Contubernalis alkalaceticus]